jgi:hypothetical protein
MPLIENHPHLLLSGPVGEQPGLGMGKVIPQGQSAPQGATLVPVAGSLAVITW